LDNSLMHRSRQRTAPAAIATCIVDGDCLTRGPKRQDHSAVRRASTTIAIEPQPALDRPRRDDTKPHTEILPMTSSRAMARPFGQLERERKFIICGSAGCGSRGRQPETYAFGAEIIDRIPVAKNA